MPRLLIKLAILALILTDNSRRATAESDNNSLEPPEQEIEGIQPAAAVECEIGDTAAKKQCHGCNTVLRCDQTKKEPLGSAQCLKDYPYCLEGLCVKEDQGCNPNSMASDRTCPGKNKYYPDLESCYVYYSCDENGAAGGNLTCPTNFPFDFAAQRCKSGVPCSTINCAGKDFASHPLYPTLGTFCENGRPVEAFYIECPESYQIGPSTDCEFKCTKQGSFPNKDNLQKYFVCLPDGPWGALTKYEMTCPGSALFDPAEKKCK